MRYYGKYYRKQHITAYQHQKFLFEPNDIIICNVYSYDIISFGEKFKVLNITESSSSYKHQLLNLESINHRNISKNIKFDARNFKLVSRHKKEENINMKNKCDTPAAVIIRNAELVTIIYEKVRDIENPELILPSVDDQINECVSKLLAKNPTQKFDVYKFEKSGSLPPINVNWHTNLI